MPHQKNPVESLREEFEENLLKDVESGGFIFFEDAETTDYDTDVIFEWMIKKLSSQREQLLAEILEEIGGDVPVPDNGYTTLGESKDFWRGVNEERDITRSILLAKKKQ